MSKRKKNNVAGGIIIVLLLLAIGVGGVYLLVNRQPEAGPEFSTSRSPIMKSAVKDDEGEDHSFETRFAIELKNDLAENIDVDTIFGAAQSTLGTLDYEAVREPGGLEYVREAILQDIAKLPGVNPEAVTGLYFTDFLTDSPIGEYSLPENQQFDRVFKSLFKNAN